MKFFKSYFLAAIISCAAIAESFADEQLFGYLQGAETIPQGGKQVYQWVTHRQQRSQGKFSAQDYRTEFEYGFTNKLQGSLYLNARSFHIKDSAPIEDGAATYRNRNDSIRFDGASAALKYNVLSPFKPNKFGDAGLALYIEPGYSTIFNVTGEEMQSPYIETKIIIQKNFLEERLVTAFNIENDFVKRRFVSGSDNKWQNDFELNLYAGASYLVKPNWYLGFEGRYHSEYPQTQNVNDFATMPRYGARQQYAKWVGPNIHYTTRDWWFTFTWLTQVGSNATNNDHKKVNLYLVDHEKNEFRLKIAYNFL